MKNLLLYINLLCPFILTYAGQSTDLGQKNFYFTHINGNDGLSESNIKSIVQDSYGFMWFGTKNGLNRYDGKSIRVIDCDDHIKGQKNHCISALCEDNDRKLWVGTDIGVFIYDPVMEIFTFQDMPDQNGSPMDNWVADIKTDLSGNMWIVVPNQGVFRYNDGKLHHYFITDNYNTEKPECICVRENGEVWIGTNLAGLFLYNEESNSFTQFLTDKNGNTLKNKHLYTICDYGDYIAIGVHEGELWKFNTLTGEISPMNTPGVNYSLIRNIKFYNGDLWIGTQAGLYVVNEQQNKVIHIDEDPMNPYGLSNRVVCALYKDNEEGIWLGTLFGGANYCSSPKMEFEKYVPSTNKSPINSKRIHELVEDGQGRIWIGTEDEGISVFDPETGNFKSVAYDVMMRGNNLPSLGLMIQDNKLWCGFFKKGLYTIDLDTERTTYYSQEDLNLDEPSIYAMLTDSKGNTWLGNA